MDNFETELAQSEFLKNQASQENTKIQMVRPWSPFCYYILQTTLHMKKKILIAEDNPVVNKVLQLLLRPRYEIIAAMNGKQAVDMTVTQMPDLILMDMIMPKVNGYQATRLIRQNPKTQSIPIIAVTALSSSEEQNECFQSGCNDYISKPFTTEDLVPSIERLLM